MAYFENPVVLINQCEMMVAAVINHINFIRCICRFGLNSSIGATITAKSLIDLPTAVLCVPSPV